MHAIFSFRYSISFYVWFSLIHPLDIGNLRLTLMLPACYSMLLPPVIITSFLDMTGTMRTFERCFLLEYVYKVIHLWEYGSVSKDNLHIRFCISKQIFKFKSLTWPCEKQSMCDDTRWSRIIRMKEVRLSGRGGIPYSLSSATQVSWLVILFLLKKLVKLPVDWSY